MKFVRSTIVTLLLVAVYLLGLSIAQEEALPVPQDDLYADTAVPQEDLLQNSYSAQSDWSYCPLYDRNPCEGEVYDFIVVGSGASGSIVASRLAQSNKLYTILVLEAGGPSQRDLCGRDYVQSSFYNDSQGNLQVGEPFTRYDVPFYYGTVGASEAYAEDIYQIPGVSIGRLVGGGMAHNGMVWFRPTQENLDSWGVTGWEWVNYLPYLRRSENVTGTPFAGSPLRGTNGPIKITDTPFKGLNDLALFRACLALGEANNTDPNGASRDGCGYLQTNTRRGVRSSSAIEYLRPQLLRNPRIKTRIHAQATKINFETDYYGKKTAVGVDYYINQSGQKYTVRARREVILAAGTINTPKLLTLSGVGPAAQLQRFGIPAVRVNENVGRNLRNHKVAGMAYNWTNPILRPNIYAFGAATLEYATYGTGILAQFPLSPDIFNFRTRTGLTQADVTMLMNWGLGSVLDSFTINPSVWTSNPLGANGTVTLASANPFVEPIVNQALTAYAPDLATLARGIQRVRQLFATPYARSVFNVTELTPGPAYATTAQLINWLNQPGSVTGAYHYMGTCRMGNPGDSSAVVDNRLRVLGLKGLRIVDASVIPGTIFFGAQTAVVGVAEKAADIILQDNL